jgi:D-glycero-D-manno-heptose 1,7-bisphosphate phosphatase
VQAVILAGGRGERLLPLTRTIPKPMIRFHGKPFLEYLIEQLRDQGYHRVLLLLGYLADTIQEYFADGGRLGVHIDYQVSAVEDDTGRRLLLARERIDPVFLFMYCDNYVPFSHERAWEIYRRERAAAVVTVYANDDGYTRSNLRVDDSGRVVVYDKERKTEGLQGVDIGYMMVQKSVLDRLPQENCSFERVVYPELVREGKLYAYVTRHRYYSVGDHKRLPLTEAFLARHPTVLVDRDGVLNRKMPPARYVRSWEEWEWLAGAREALRLFHQAGYRVIVISNQPGIARGAMTQKQLEDVHERMRGEVREAGGHIEAIYYCPHDWDEGCPCRKPAPGMLFAAQRDFHLDLSRTCFLGDDERDGMAANAAGAPWIQVTPQRSFYQIAKDMTKRVG